MNTPFDTLPFPPSRRIVVDAGFLGSGRHIIYGLIEADVTRAREAIDQLAGGQSKLSFTAFIAASLARAIAAHPRVQAYQDWRGRLVIFHDVDVVTMIEPKQGKVAIPHIIRAANLRSVAEISSEIRAIQNQPETSQQSGDLVKLAPRVPRFMRLLFFRLVKLNPHWFKVLQGTAVLTSVGMFGKGGGWGITFLPSHTLGLTVGGITQKPRVREGQIEVRQVLDLTLAFDHDLVDGAPAARFARKLIDLIESAELLAD